MTIICNYVVFIIVTHYQVNDRKSLPSCYTYLVISKIFFL